MVFGEMLFNLSIRKFLDFDFRHSLDLLEILLKLSEVKKLSNNVAALIRKPMSNIPDILVLALIQLQVYSFQVKFFTRNIFLFILEI